MPAENSNRLNILIFILLIGLSLSLLLYLKNQLFQQAGGKEGPHVQSDEKHSTVPHSPVKISSGNIAEQVRRLEQEQRDLDNTVWKSEMISQVHEKVFIDLWDKLNRANNKINILAEFPFGKVILGKVSDPQFLENRYTQIHTQGFLKAINPSDTVSLLRDYRKKGYRIVESEWRHPQFEILPDNRYRSVISMKMFLKKENTRFMLQGKLGILWKRSTGLMEPPFSEEIDATELTLLKQSALPAFARRLYREIQPTYNKKLIDPLLIHDLDGDGFSEIILASANRVFRNLGNLNFKEEALCRLPSKDPYSAIFADLNSDGVTDFICVERNRILMFEGSVDGRFESPGIPVWAPPETMPNPFCLTTGDVDADGDLDVWLAQYKVPYVAGQMPTPFYDANDGFPSYLLINRGDGFLEDATQSSGLGV
ncbi:MAG TPA: VCBS repeat-containing protein, partial [Verrucomicrobia bacterium]|nr:VCBS repeat-containing protein [Verrucomicrobiota bacterium]